MEAAFSTTPWEGPFQKHHGSDPFNNTMGGALSTTPWEGPFNNTMGETLSTTPWERSFQQHHGSDPFNNTMGGTLSTTPWERSFQQHHRSDPFNKTMGAPYLLAISRDTMEPFLLAVGMTVIVHNHGWLYGLLSTRWFFNAEMVSSR